MSTAELSAKKASIKEILAQDSIAEAIKSLKQWFPREARIYEDLLLIEARQNDTNRKRLRNVVSDQELQIAYNKIREDLLDLIDSVQPTDFDTSVPDSKISGSKKAKQGHILHRILHRMQHLQETRCIVRIALNEDTIIENIDLDEHVKLESVRVSDLMQVELMDPAEEPAFAIRTINTPEQFIDEDDYTEWQFFVKPLKTGTFSLLLKVAVIELVYGKERKREIVLEQAIDIVTTHAEEGVTPAFQSAGYTLNFSATDKAVLEGFRIPAPPSATAAVPQARSAPEYRPPVESAAPSPRSMRPFRGTAAQRVALSLAGLIAFVCVTWAVSPAEVEWIATRYFLDTAAAYERFVERHEDSRHVEKAVWRKAGIVDQPQAYLDYLEQFPEAAAARADDLALPQLEARVFEAVSPRVDSSLLRSYLRVFPAGQHHERIRFKLDSIESVKGRLPDSAPSSLSQPSVNGQQTEPTPSIPPVITSTQKAQLEKQATELPEALESPTTKTQEQIPFDPVPPPEVDGREGKQSETSSALGAYEKALDMASFFDGNYGTVQDLAGHTYRTVPLNGQTWMADNLNVEVADSWCYENDPKNCAQYGRLYTWEAAKKACISLGPGWRLPTDREWRDMAKDFGGADFDASDDGKAAYQALIDGGSSGWSSQLGGSRNSDVSFASLGDVGYYWSATEDGSDVAWYYNFDRGSGKLYRGSFDRAFGFSCRCVQGAPSNGND